MSEPRTRSVRSADGTKIGWEISGSGPPLVLVHGSSADHRRWATVLEAFEREYTVHAVDRRGRGLSTDTEPYAIEREFEDLVMVIDEIGEPVRLLGHSYGAVCSLEATLRTKNVTKLVLYEPPLPIGLEIATDDLLARIDEFIAQGDREQAVLTFLTQIARMDPADVERMRLLPMWQGRIDLAHTLTREERIDRSYRPDLDRCAGIDIPVLLLTGSKSAPLLTEPVRMLEKIMPNARLVVMEGQGHAAMDTGAELFVREVLGFLTD